ncbi:hypothetical protein DMB42_50460 [Nonomuraea sp. WAC 01424]|nr:hypothetical protein DMB42_50460 [Nonomuraea sp. WAC 01424]
MAGQRRGAWVLEGWRPGGVPCGWVGVFVGAEVFGGAVVGRGVEPREGEGDGGLAGEVAAVPGVDEPGRRVSRSAPGRTAAGLESDAEGPVPATVRLVPVAVGLVPVAVRPVRVLAGSGTPEEVTAAGSDDFATTGPESTAAGFGSLDVHRPPCGQSTGSRPGELNASPINAPAVASMSVPASTPAVISARPRRAFAPGLGEAGVAVARWDPLTPSDGSDLWAWVGQQ